MHFAISCAIAAILLTLVDDRIRGDNSQGWEPSQILTLFVAFGVAVAVTTLTYTWVTHRVELLAGKKVRSGGFRALPLALLLAGLMAALSFALEFNPGSLRAGGSVHRGRLRREGNGAGRGERGLGRGRGQGRVLTAALVTLMLAFVVWLAWDPVDRLVEQDGAMAAREGLDLALSVFVIVALETVMFALLPIPLLDGATLIRWSRLAWFTVFPLTAFSFVYLTITETTSPYRWDEILKMAAAFAVFGVVSVIAWSIVRQRVEAQRRDGDYAGARE